MGPALAPGGARGGRPHGSWWSGTSGDLPPGRLMPSWLARLSGFAALASLGALEWQRLIAGLSAGRALLWMLVAVLAALLVLAAGARRAPLVGAVVTSALLGYAVSGAPLRLLWPRHWGEL